MQRFLLAAISTLLVYGGSGGAWAQATRDGYGTHMHMWGGGYGWFFGPIMMIAFIAVTVIVIVLIVRWLGGTSHASLHPAHGPLGKTPIDILKERYARGEIDKEEFEERRKVLGD
ncbi:MAG: SHOCT domain-containing protein [Alphaproteobacteria bacterium]|nr:SHOCT domain-containing protein [Alphaproteobacteria bacterium]